MIEKLEPTSGIESTMGKNYNEKTKEEVNGIFNQATIDYPIGTKFLIELEVVETEGRNNTMACMFAKDKIEEFQDLTGCFVTKIFVKGVQAQTEQLTLNGLIKSLQTRVIKLNMEGIN